MNNNFDDEFQKLFTEMVELAFEFVNNNSDEVDAVYVIGLIEKGYFYKQFYKINGTVIESHKVNTVSKMQYDISNVRAFSLLNLGNELLKKIEYLFKSDNRDVPTMLKLIYYPKTGKLESDFGYEKNFSNSNAKTAQDVYEDWFNDIKKSFPVMAQVCRVGKAEKGTCANTHKSQADTCANAGHYAQAMDSTAGNENLK